MALRLVPFVSVFTIIPFSVAPKYSKIATGGVADPQLWDMEADKKAPRDAELATRLRTAARGRRILAFMGTASEIKGIEFLHDLVTDPTWPQDQFLLVIAGKFPQDTQALSEQFSDAGALVFDRFISDDELQTLYTSTDFVWACYRPDYDQASGIFGRAVQLSKTPVLRAGSQIALLARQNGVSAVELDYASSSLPINFLAKSTSGNTPGMAAKISSWERDFVEKVGAAL